MKFSKIKIIGGGLVGLSLAYKLTRLYNKYEVCVFEKEKKPGLHQSSRNSGVLHCGLPYKPGSLKAKLTNSGFKQIKDFCKEYNVKYDICGKLIPAYSVNEVEKLKELLLNGQLNGLQGLRILAPDDIKRIEPNINCKAALHVPEEGIVDFKGIVNKMSDLIIQNGGKIITDLYFTKNNIEQNDLIINCGGLYSDKIFEDLTGLKSDIKIIPFRGDYYKIKKGIIKNLIYPIPDKKLPFLGVHFTRLTDGSFEVGPNAALAFKREGYKFYDFSFKQLLDSLFYRGLIKFVLKNLVFCLKELISSLSKNMFYKDAVKLLPNLKISDIYNIRRSGVRAQAVTRNGKLLMDFKIKVYKNQVHILNAPSPGATSCLAIADHIINNYLNNKL